LAESPTAALTVLPSLPTSRAGLAAPALRAATHAESRAAPRTRTSARAPWANAHATAEPDPEALLGGQLTDLLLQLADLLRLGIDLLLVRLCRPQAQQIQLRAPKLRVQRMHLLHMLDLLCCDRRSCPWRPARIRRAGWTSLRQRRHCRQRQAYYDRQ
jgi:hypothetical protein